MPSLPVGFHPAALEESIAAELWYRERSATASAAFVAELERSVVQIGNSPERWPPHGHGARRFLLRRFPFSVIYRVGPVEVEIIAVAHGRRRPNYWQGR
jgi:plasmid stabilization system protein ParE